MAYFRGDLTIFFDGEGRFHFWRRGGYDGWRDTGWGQRCAANPTGVEDAGVCIPGEQVDQFVLMRLAEMLVDQIAIETLDSMREGLSDPEDPRELARHRDLLHKTLADLQRVMKA